MGGWRITKLGVASTLGVVGVSAAVAYGRWIDTDPAKPLTVNGMAALLTGGEPCISNGDSGCGFQELSRSDPVLCVKPGATLTVAVGAHARELAAAASESTHGGNLPSGLGMHSLVTRRRDDRHFSVTLLGDLDRKIRALQINVRYASRVNVRYEYLDGTHHAVLKSGSYLLRLSLRDRSGTCPTPPVDPPLDEQEEEIPRGGPH